MAVEEKGRLHLIIADVTVGYSLRLHSSWHNSTTVPGLPDQVAEVREKL